MSSRGAFNSALASQPMPVSVSDSMYKPLASLYPQHLFVTQHKHRSTHIMLHLHSQCMLIHYYQTFLYSTVPQLPLAPLDYLTFMAQGKRICLRFACWGSREILTLSCNNDVNPSNKEYPNVTCPRPVHTTSSQNKLCDFSQACAISGKRLGM